MVVADGWLLFLIACDSLPWCFCWCYSSLFPGHRLRGRSTLIGQVSVLGGLWVNLRHGRGPRDQVTAPAMRGTIISSIVGDIGNSIVRVVGVSIVSLSSVRGVSVLRSIFLVGWNVLRDWSPQSTIPVYLFWFLLKLMPLLCQWYRLFVYMLVGILS